MKKVESKQAFMTEEEVINALARSKNELPKALASSNERSELLTMGYQQRKTFVRTTDARLRAVGQVMREK